MDLSIPAVPESTNIMCGDGYSRMRWIGTTSTARFQELPLFGPLLAVGLDPIMTIATTVCAAVPIVKNAFILAGQYGVSKELAAATISITTAASTVTLLLWLIALAHIYPGTVPT